MSKLLDFLRLENSYEVDLEDAVVAGVSRAPIAVRLEAAREASDHTIRWEMARTVRWVPVEVELPPENEVVLVVFADDRSVQIALYDSGMWLEWDRDCKLGAPISHWALLPKPPRGP